MLWSICSGDCQGPLPKSQPLSKSIIPHAMGLGSPQSDLYSAPAFPNFTLGGRPTSAGPIKSLSSVQPFTEHLLCPKLGYGTEPICFYSCIFP